MLAAATASNATAQLPSRPDAGRALDANPRLGSGGYNAVRNDFSTINATNRFITGNVTGLGQFHGFSPISNTSTFQAGLGSAGLSFFNRRSVSVSDVISGQTQAGLPYFSRSRTVIGLGGIVSGLNQPGSSLPASRFQPPLIAPWAPQPDRLTRPVTPDEWFGGGRALYVPPDAVLQANQPNPSFNTMSQLRSTNSPFSRAMRSPLFGIDAVARLEELAAEEDPTPTAFRAARVLTSMFERRAVGTRIAELDGNVLRSAVDVEPGLDVFTDVHNALSDQRMPVVAPQDAGDAQRAAEPSRGAAQDKPEVTGLKPSLRPPPDLAEQERAAHLSARLVQGQIRSFAGRSQDEFNQLMRSGEAAMHDHRFYDAAQRFRAAQLLAPDNPLAFLSCGHALAAAGDYLEAVDHIREGLRQFPMVATLSLDLNELLGGKTICDARKADLTKWLARRERVELRFLLGYLEFYSGDADAGRRHLEQSSADPSASEVIRGFPDLIAG
ncbi:MAG: hypothetical protein V3T70_12095 [Phycisphaerae bacterium]